MSVRSRVGLLFLSLVAASAAHCGSSSSADKSAAVSPSTSDAAACGTRASMRGKTSRTLTVDGTARTYIAYLPKSLDATTASPFVFVTHGAEMNAAEMYDITQYAALADSEGIAVAFLDGQDTSSSAGTMTLDPWNVSDNGAQVCGDGTLANNPNAGVDFAFMDAVKADITQDQCLDSEHVFATGFSMGGYFTHHIACDRTDIRADAPHSGGTLASLSSCKTGHVPIIIFHGAADPLIAPGCDDPNSAAQSGFPPSATLWAQKNGCQNTYSTVPENGDGGGDGQCYVYDGCPSDGQVELCTFTGMGHCWAGGSTAGSGGTFSCPTYTSATQLEWNFFKKYAW
jgi:polyhydroxybutyrate depolymerase